jgi:hypothetical protein
MARQQDPGKRRTVGRSPHHQYIALSANRFRERLDEIRLRADISPFTPIGAMALHQPIGLGAPRGCSLDREISTLSGVTCRSG